jgi:hypothetical protein
MTARVQLDKKKKKNMNSGREPQGAWRQDELVGGKPPVVKVVLTLTLAQSLNVGFLLNVGTFLGTYSEQCGFLSFPHLLKEYAYI